MHYKKIIVCFFFMSLLLQEFSWGQIQNYMIMTLDGGSSVVGGTITTGKTDGTYTQLFHDFAEITDGFFPQGTMMLSKDNNFYGMCTNGGDGTGYGVIFKISPSGVFTKLRGLSPPDGGNPAGDLIQGTDSSFYGLCYSGGTHAYGTIFKITPSGVFTKLRDLSIADGVNPYGDLLQGTDGDFYGTCFQGGSNFFGTIFKITSTGIFTKLKDLASIDGINPNGNLVEYTDGNFYGMCSDGGAYGFGTIFKISPSGVFTKIWDFNALDGKYPLGSLTLDVDGTFYGMCSSGGDFYDAVNDVDITNGGTIFKITPTGAFTKIWDLNKSGGASPRGNLVKSSDGNFYGVGSNELVFRISPSGVFTTVNGLGFLTRGSLILFDNFTQTITGLSLDSLALCAPKKLVLTNVSASSGLPVTFSSSDLSVATVSGNTITVLTVGVTTITAFQPGNGLYEAAKPFVQILKVIPEPVIPTLTLTSIPSGPACDKENISFISNFTNIGSNPVFSLLRNGDLVSTSSGFVFNSSVLGNGDIMTVKMSSISTSCLVTVQDFITVTINSLPSVMISGFIPVCEGSSSILTASGAKFYRWNTGSTDSTSNVFPTATSTFVVTGTGSNGCSNSAKMTITVPGIGIDLSSFNQICNTVGSIALTGGIPKGGTYWYSNAPVTKLDISKGGEYIIAYRYKNPYLNSCLNTVLDTLFIQVCLTICERPNPPCYCTNTCPPPFKIYTAITPNGDTYNDTWIIDSLYTPNQITILDKWGNEIYHCENYMQDWNGTKDGKQLPPGIYFYVAEIGLDKRRFSGNLSIIK